MEHIPQVLYSLYDKLFAIDHGAVAGRARAAVVLLSN